MYSYLALHQNKRKAKTSNIKPTGSVYSINGFAATRGVCILSTPKAPVDSYRLIEYSSNGGLSFNYKRNYMVGSNKWDASNRGQFNGVIIAGLTCKVIIFKTNIYCTLMINIL